MINPLYLSSSIALTSGSAGSPWAVSSTTSSINSSSTITPTLANADDVNAIINVLGPVLNAMMGMLADVDTKIGTPSAVNTNYSSIASMIGSPSNSSGGLAADIGATASKSIGDLIGTPAGASLAADVSATGPIGTLVSAIDVSATGPIGTLIGTSSSSGTVLGELSATGPIGSAITALGTPATAADLANLATATNVTDAQTAITNLIGTPVTAADIATAIAASDTLATAAQIETITNSLNALPTADDFVTILEGTVVGVNMNML